MTMTVNCDLETPSLPFSSKAALWTGRAASALAILFLTFDTVLKVLQLAPAIEGVVQLGFPASSVVILGVVEVACLVLYLVPRTALLGAVLWTGYLGGALASHVRLGNPLFSHVLFPVYVAVALWGGLWLRDSRVNAMFGPRSSTRARP